MRKELVWKIIPRRIRQARIIKKEKTVELELILSGKKWKRYMIRAQIVEVKKLQ